MSKTNHDNHEIEQVLRKVRPTEPSAELRERVVSASRKAWKETPAEIPWQIPFRRLAISAAAAVLIVSCANLFSRQAVVRWRADRPAVARVPTAEFDEMWEVPYSPFVQHLVAVRRSSERDPSALSDYFERLRGAFDETEPQMDDADGSGPTGSRSRLIPTESSAASHA